MLFRSQVGAGLPAGHRQLRLGVLVAVDDEHAEAGPLDDPVGGQSVPDRRGGVVAVDGPEVTAGLEGFEHLGRHEIAGMDDEVGVLDGGLGAAPEAGGVAAVGIRQNGEHTTFTGEEV